MNQIVKTFYPEFKEYQALRDQLMGLLTDKDLSFQLKGNQTLGELCREIGEVEHAYIHSYRTFSQNFTYRNKQPHLETSVKKLNEWFAKLDADLLEVVGSLSDEDLTNRVIDRGFEVTPLQQLETYRQALLIFYGKVSVYLKAMGKELPQQWQEWIA